MLAAEAAKAWASKHHRVILAVVGFFGVVAIAVLFSPAFQECMKANQAYDKGDYSYNGFTSFLGIAYWCGGIFAKENGEAVTAFASVAIAVFTWTLWRSTENAGELTKRTIDIEERQLALAGAQHIAEHRPELRVRHVSLVGSFGTPWAFTQGDTIFGRLIVVNAGGSKAKIESSKYKVLLSNDGMPVESPLNDTGWELITLPKTFDIGESCEFEFQDAVNISTIPNTTVFLTDFDQGNWVAYVFGQIQYADETGNSRFMGFCRQWTGKGPFIATTDPDYEYQD